MKRLLVLALFFLAGCHSNAQSSTTISTPTTRSSFGAVSIEHPASWHGFIHDDGYIAFAGPDGERMVVWPVFVERPLTDAAAADVLNTLARKLEGTAAWTPAQSVAGGVLRADAADSERRVTALLSYGTGRGGSAGILYLAAAPRPRFPSAVFGRMASSVTVADASSRPRRSYVTFTDPNEEAFTMDAPLGWHVEGGLVRVAAVDTRPHVRIKAPDGGILIFGGDAQIPPFAVPHRMLTFAGFPEGSWYSPGYGVPMLVRSYQGGVDFAREYARTFCGDVEMLETRDRPETAEAMNRIAAQYGGVVAQRVDAGDVAFRCGGRTGYVFAATRLTTMPQYDMGIWNVDQLYGFLADNDQTGDAQEALAHVVQSFRLNPQWVRMQTGLAGNVSGIVAETSAHISGVVRDAYEFKSASDDRTMREFAESLRGVETIVDPATGDPYEVKSGANHYWLSRLGEVVGTDIYQNPDALKFEEAFHAR